MENTIPELPESQNPLPGKAGFALPILTALFLLGLYLASQKIPYSQTSVLLVTLGTLFLTLLLTVTLARVLALSRHLPQHTAAAALLFLPGALLPILLAQFHSQFLRSTALLFGPWLRLEFGVPGLPGTLLIYAAACLGVWLSRLMREMKILLPVAVVLACMDMFVVFGGGLVTKAVQTPQKAKVARTAMHTLSAALPALKPAPGSAPIQLSVGFADYLFISLFFACFARFNLPERNIWITFAVLSLTLVCYLALVYLLSIDLPALVPIAVVVIGANMRFFRYQRSEWFALLYAGIIVACLLGWLVYSSHH